MERTGKDIHMIKQAKQSEVEKLYQDFIDPYFPEDEKKPLAVIERLVATGLYQILYVEKEGDICGAAFLTTYPGGRIYLLDYLAVREDVRSKGYGGELLRACLNATEGLPVLIETESLESAPDEEELAVRKRRNQFYQRNGAVMSPVVSNVFSVEFNNWVLVDGEMPMADAIRQAIRDIYWFMLDNEELFRQNVLV